MTSGLPDWTVWVLAAVVAGLFGWFFWHTGVSLYRSGRQVVDLIQNWPQVRREMVEAEVRSGGRYPLWFRAVRVLLVLAMIGFAIVLIWRKLGGA
jgi:uncharacterized membrane protein YqiK